MSKPHRLWVAAVCVLALGLLIALIWCSQPSPSWSPDELLNLIRTSDKVKLIFQDAYSDRHGRHVHASAVLADPASVNGLVSLVALEAKEPCLCDHDQQMIFCKGFARLSVSVCDHCFDVVFNRGSHEYKMPPALWKEFCALHEQYKKTTRTAEPPD